MSCRPPALDTLLAGVERDHAEPRLSAHILPTSATMIGVCMTVLSIRHLAPGGEFLLVIDKLLALDAVVFLISALLSFASLRTLRHGRQLEARAELVFTAGLVLLVLVAVVLVVAIH